MYLISFNHHHVFNTLFQIILAWIYRNLTPCKSSLQQQLGHGQTMLDPELWTQRRADWQVACWVAIKELVKCCLLSTHSARCRWWVRIDVRYVRVVLRFPHEIYFCAYTDSNLFIIAFSTKKTLVFFYFYMEKHVKQLIYCIFNTQDDIKANIPTLNIQIGKCLGRFMRQGFCKL